MSNIPSELKYTSSHEWALKEDSGSVVVGITDHAQHLLGDIVFVELPEIGSEVKAGNECAVIESVKAAADVYSPVSGEVLEINENLMDAPALLNNDPYGDGWLFQIRIHDENELQELLDADHYANEIDE